MLEPLREIGARPDQHLVVLGVLTQINSDQQVAQRWITLHERAVRGDLNVVDLPALGAEPSLLRQPLREQSSWGHLLLHRRELEPVEAVSRHREQIWQLTDAGEVHATQQLERGAPLDPAQVELDRLSEPRQVV